MKCSHCVMPHHSYHPNAILASLPAEEHRLIRKHGQSVELPLGTVLYEEGAGIDFLYFPTSGLVSELGTTQDGLSVELGAVGREGVIGLPMLLGNDRQQHHTVVQQSGTTYQVPADVFKRHRLDALQRAAGRYAHLRMVELSQSAVCNQFHPIRQRLCRWLLTSHKRTGVEKLEFTQDLLSQMLGARRPVVTIAAQRLQHDGAIEYRRGSITILDRHILHSCACECYDIVRQEFEKYLESLTQV